MTNQKAVVQTPQHGSELRTDVPLPKLPEGQWMLVKTRAVALNPTDWKGMQRFNAPGSIVGCDYAGIVEEVGKDVTDVKVGDKVAGFARGGDSADHSNGAFAEHIKAKIGPHLRFGDNVSFEDAATLGVGISTVGQGLYQQLSLPLPPAKLTDPIPVMIYGASTATGTLAVQFAKLSGAEVIALASPHNFDLLRTLGADQVFDYREPDVGSKIRKATNDKLKLVFDCISEGGSAAISAAAMSSAGGHYTALLALDFPRQDVKSTLTMAYTAIGEKHSDRFPANQEDYKFGSKFWKVAEEMLNSGKLKAHPIEKEDGLEKVPEGLTRLKEGRVSGKKLVYTVA